MVVGGAAWVTALRVEVRRLDVEADVPASAVPTTGREQDPGPRRDHKLPGASIVLRDGTEQPPQSTGVVMYMNRADLRQSHRAGMTFPDRIDQAALPALLRSRKLSRHRPLRLYLGKPTLRPWTLATRPCS
jgi:hypothetical protein